MDNERKIWEDFKDGNFPYIPWYNRLFIWHHNKELRTFKFQLWDCSVTHKSLTKLHRFDILVKNHRKWYHPKYIGFNVWFK